MDRLAYGRLTDAQRRRVALEAGSNPDTFRFADFQPYLCWKIPELAYCRIVATAAKHSECGFGAELDFGPDIRLGPSFNIAGVSALQRRWVLKMYVGKDRIPASDVFDRALAFWTDF